MRSMWKGTINFAMVSVPVKMYLATDSNEITFHQCHAEDGGRIKQKRFCSVCEWEVAFSEVAKGYEQADGTHVILTDADLASLPLDTVKAISVEQFVNSAEIPVIYMSGNHYYLAPESAGAKRAYALLRGALAESDLTAVVKVTLRSRERLGILRPDGDVIVLELLNYEDEVRDPNSLPNLEPVMLGSKETKMARQLVQAMTGKFDPSEHADAYKDALAALVSAKLAGTDLPERPEPDVQPDMEAQLSASLSALRSAK